MRKPTSFNCKDMDDSRALVSSTYRHDRVFSTTVSIQGLIAVL